VVSFGTRVQNPNEFAAGETGDIGDGVTLRVDTDGTYALSSPVAFEGSRGQRIFYRAAVPPKFTLDNYREVLSSAGIGQSFINSLTVTIPATIIPILIAAYAAYALAWMKFPGRALLLSLVVGLLVVPLQMSLIPLLKFYNDISTLFGVPTKTYLGIWIAHTGQRFDPASSSSSSARRLREVDAAAHRSPGSRTSPAARSRSTARSSPGCRPRARHRDGVPVLRALPAHERLREHGLRAEAGEAQGRDRQAGEAAADMLQLTPISTASPAPSPAASASASPSAAPSCATPKIFLFDEPLSNLDAALRVATRIEIAKLHRACRRRHHDLCHPRPGRGDDAGRPHRRAQCRQDRAGRHADGPLPPARQPLRRPLHRLAGDEHGPCTIDSGGATPVVTPLGGKPVGVEIDIPDSARGSQGTFGVRPEDLVLAEAGNAVFSGTVQIVEKLGEVTLIYVDCGKSDEPVLAKLDGIVNLKRGDTVHLGAPIAALHVFDTEGRAYRRRD
jgi:ABC-type sugar transport system ATPase subunit